jgi:hypothetical protein
MKEKERVTSTPGRVWKQKIEGAAEHDRLLPAIYAAVSLMVETMTPTIVRDNARTSHVALTRTNSTLLTHGISRSTGTGGMDIVPRTNVSASAPGVY